MDEKFGGFPPPQEKPKEEKIPWLAERLKKEYHKKLGNRIEGLLARFGINFEDTESTEEGEKIVREIKKTKHIREGDEGMFFDISGLKKWGEGVIFKAIARIDKKYKPYRNIDYDKKEPSPEREAEKWLERESRVLKILKENKYLKEGGDPISADEYIESNIDREQGDMFLVKKVAESDKSCEEFGETDGRALAKALINMQENLDATGMMNEIMRARGIEGEHGEKKYKLENQVMEDYTDTHEGMVDNTRVVLEDNIEDENLRQKVEEKIESFKEIIDACDLEEGQYSLAHGKCFLDNMVSKDGKILLSDWNKSGTTLNREMSLVWDLADAFSDALERLDEERAQEFIRGAEDAIRSHYGSKEIESDNNISGSQVAEAVIKITRLRALAMSGRGDLLREELGKKR